MAASMDLSRYRLFFALMPSPCVAAQIAHRAGSLGGSTRALARDRLHLTLAFIGGVDAQGKQAALAAGDAIHAPAFTLIIDQAGRFDRAGFNWLAPGEAPPSLLDLSRELYKNTRSELDKSLFKPHITIARKAAKLDPGLVEPITWSVTNFSLIASGVAGAPGAYRELRRWSLSPPRAGV